MAEVAKGKISGKILRAIAGNSHECRRIVGVQNADGMENLISTEFYLDRDRICILIVEPFYKR